MQLPKVIRPFTYTDIDQDIIIYGKDRIMQNQYVILTAMYRYAPTFFSDHPSPEKLSAKLLSFNPHTIPGAKALTKKALESNYGITNRSQLEATIDELMLCNVWEGPLYAILIDLFLESPERFSQLRPQDVEQALNEQSKLNTYLSRFSPANQMLNDSEHKQEYTKELVSNVAAYFTEDAKATLEALEALFRHNQAWLHHTDGTSWAAFNYSRAISIIADGAICGYLTEEEAGQWCDKYGSMAERLFRNWQTFLFSAILGKQLMTPAQDRFILGANDYIEGCYKLAVSPLKPLEISGIWPGSNLSALIQAYEGQYSNDPSVNVKKSGPIDLYERTVLPIFRKYKVDYFLLEKKGNAVFYYSPTESAQSGDASYFDMYLEDFEGELEPGEIPFLTTEKCLFTNKYIRIHVKKLFRKKQKLAIPWNGAVELKWEPTGLQDIRLNVNGQAALDIRPNLDRIGMTTSQTLGLSKKETQELYAPDLENLNQAIRELKQTFSA
ncbi:DUF1266 domain-containing protein [Paenibacillus senegalimassiliensis]|uniref:DUF1266 domain-containing protein n=1 Tax=Paenibacillus senegalimassiliensis TaxID=1737426 RepID=UPI0011DDBCDA|nr:DUF1266 domain-containing protein [Paenibacillus senegalimassiliensis]